MAKDVTKDKPVEDTAVEVQANPTLGEGTVVTEGTEPIGQTKEDKPKTVTELVGGTIRTDY